ncbi:sensor histidine kinase [Gloeocapsa sp. PCC 7428]
MRDPGIGILKEEHKNLFDSLYRGSNTRTIPGTNLGIAVVT